MDFCLKNNLNQYHVCHNLNQISIKDSYQKSLLGPIQLEILHHKISENILGQIAQLADLQGFFIDRVQWMIGVDKWLPSFIHLRPFEDSTISAKYQQDVVAMREQVKIIDQNIYSDQLLGYSGKPITNIVNIGIGGSDLGPKFYFDALKSMQKNAQLKCHFISDADFYSTKECLSLLNPETTLFIVSSKSFLTEETMMNVEIAKQWIDKPHVLENHFIAVTANSTRAKELGYVHIIAYGDWFVGHYSITSAINLINTIIFGVDNYLEFIQGAEEMDKLFLSATWQENILIILAFIDIWNINFLKLPTQLMLVYHSKLRYLVDYVQQMDMESNGKSYNIEGSHQVAIDFLSIEDDKNDYLNQLCLKRKTTLFMALKQSINRALSNDNKVSIIFK